MKLAKILTPVVALALFVTTANAAVIGLNTVQSPAEAAGAGFIANDILINFEGNLSGQQLYIQLDGADEVYNEPTLGVTPPGGDAAPNPALFAGFPPLEFDTFVTIGGLTSTDANTRPTLVVGGAANIPGAPAEKSLVGGTISATWAPGTGVVIDGGTDFPIARITLPPTANGNAWYYGTTGGNSGEPLLIRRSVINGVLVPEPASMALAGLAVLGMVAIRRRS